MFPPKKRSLILNESFREYRGLEGESRLVWLRRIYKLLQLWQPRLLHQQETIQLQSQNRPLGEDEALSLRYVLNKNFHSFKH